MALLHSVLYLSIVILTQNEVYLNGGDTELEKTQNLCRDCIEVICDLSCLEHPWPLKMKFISCSELVLGLL